MREREGEWKREIRQARFFLLWGLFLNISSANLPSRKARSWSLYIIYFFYRAILGYMALLPPPPPFHHRRLLSFFSGGMIKLFYFVALYWAFLSAFTFSFLLLYSEIDINYLCVAHPCWRGCNLKGKMVYSRKNMSSTIWCPGCKRLCQLHVQITNTSRRSRLLGPRDARDTITEQKTNKTSGNDVNEKDFLMKEQKEGKIYLERLFLAQSSSLCLCIARFNLKLFSFHISPIKYSTR